VCGGYCPITRCPKEIWCDWKKKEGNGERSLSNRSWTASRGVGGECSSLSCKSGTADAMSNEGLSNTITDI
ncbi:hypothetical protein ACLOJK_029787, partial [Asimina triloba]